MIPTRLTIVVFLTLALSACVTTRVHLFTEAMTEQEIRDVEHLLATHDYEVVRNSLPIPEGMLAPSLVYSPHHRRLSSVEDLRDLLANHNLIVDMEPITQTNHYYTGQNVGLYPNRYNPNRPSQLTLIDKELFGECPDVDATLLLRSNLTFTASFFVWDEISANEQTELREGTWRQNGDVVTLETGNKAHTYQLSNISGSSDYAKISGLMLEHSNSSTEWHACNFAYREMDPW